MNRTCSTLIAKEKIICCLYMSRIISLASGLDAYSLLMLATQAALSVYSTYFFLVQSLLNVEIAMIIAISSRRLMSTIAGFRLGLQIEAVK